MNATIKKISATFLSLVVMFSSMSFTIDEHFCGSRLMDVSYFGNADNCGMQKTCVNSNSPIIKNINCCEDQTTFHEPLIFNIEKSINVQKLDFQVIYCKGYSYQDFDKSVFKELEYYKDLPFPYLDLDIQVLYQTFLI